MQVFAFAVGIGANGLGSGELRMRLTTISLFIIACVFQGAPVHSMAEDAAKPVLDLAAVVNLATEHLVRNGYDRLKLNFDDARFDTGDRQWTILYWEDKGSDEITGIMVKAGNSTKPELVIIREE